MDGCQAMRVTHELKRIADSLEKLTEYLTTPFRIVGLQTQRDALVWAEDDLEPPVGTVGRNRNGRVTWTRKDDGWHCDRPGCPNCPSDWSEVTGWGGPLVEVIEPAPPQDDTTGRIKPSSLSSERCANADCACNWTPQPGQRVEWNPIGDEWKPGTVMAVHTGQGKAIVKLDDGEQLCIESRHMRPARDIETTEGER